MTLFTSQIIWKLSIVTTLQATQLNKTKNQIKQKSPKNENPL